jgi:hypothetical protein
MALESITTNRDIHRPACLGDLRLVHIVSMKTVNLDDVAL